MQKAFFVVRAVDEQNEDEEGFAGCRGFACDMRVVSPASTALLGWGRLAWSPLV